MQIDRSGYGVSCSWSRVRKNTYAHAQTEASLCLGKLHTRSLFSFPFPSSKSSRKSFFRDGRRKANFVILVRTSRAPPMLTIWLLVQSRVSEFQAEAYNLAPNKWQSLPLTEQRKRPEYSLEKDIGLSPFIGSKIIENFRITDFYRLYVLLRVNINRN